MQEANIQQMGSKDTHILHYLNEISQIRVRNRIWSKNNQYFTP